MKKSILFFARDYQNIFFPLLGSEHYDSIFVTLTKKEKKDLLVRYGIQAVACFEDYFYDRYAVDSICDESYLETSFFSDRYLGSFSIDERRKILSLERDFWKSIFSSYNPDAVINEIVAIEIAEVMQIEASRLGIQYFAWMISPFKDKSFYWLDSPYHASLRETTFTKQPSNKASDFAENYILNLNISDNVKPFYAENLSSRFAFSRIVNLLKRILTGIFGNIKLGLAKTNKYFYPYYLGDTSAIKLELDSYINSLVFNYDNIDSYAHYNLAFYPLHFEPEASILYMSEFFEDQINLIRNLSKCLRQDQVLVVKEHPQQPGILLSKPYRKLRKRLSNVIFLPAEYSTKNLILKTEIILTQTSTAGWEALVLNKPVVVFGKVFYDKYEYINVFNGFNHLKELLRTKSYTMPDKVAMLKFVANFYDYCKQGNPYMHTDLYNADNVENIKKSIESRLLESVNL